MMSFGWGEIASDIELSIVPREDKPDVSVLNFTVMEIEQLPNGNTRRHYHAMELWDTAAEYVANNGIRGDFFCYKGITRIHTWEDKDTGEKRTKTVTRPLDFKLLQTAPRPELEEVSI